MRLEHKWTIVIYVLVFTFCKDIFTNIINYEKITKPVSKHFLYLFKNKLSLCKLNHIQLKFVVHAKITLPVSITKVVLIIY